MARFRYTGTRPDGTQVEGLASANSEPELALALLGSGITLENSQKSLSLGQRLYLRVFKSDEVTRVTRQLALLLESKVDILESLQLAREGTSDRTLQAILVKLIEMIRSGRSVANTFACYPELFDSLYVSMLSAGELSGSLDTSFTRIANYREQQEATLRKLRSAMVYPLLVLGVAAVVVVVLVFYIVPIFASMYDNFGAELPVLTQNVVALSKFALQHSWWLLLIAALSLLTLPPLVLSTRTRHVVHRLLVQLPFIGPLTIRLATMRYCRTLGSLLSSGVDILIAADIAVTSAGNLAIQKSLVPVLAQLSAGSSLGESLQTVSIFPRPALRLVAAGEKTGQLGLSLLRAADFYEKESSIAIATLVSLIEPVIIICLGVLVTFLLVALYLPLFDLVGAVH